MLATEIETAILNRVIRPEEGNMSPDLARQILKLGFAESDHVRMEALSGKAEMGALSPDEQEELDSYINVSHFIALMHSKARKALQRSGN